MAAADDDLAIGAGIEPQSYPWHQAQWEILVRDLARLPHALLLHGQAGLGKKDFALRLARLLLCRTPTDDQQACAACQGCRLFRSGNHPDLVRIEPKNDSSNIVVDQIRGVTEFLSLKPHIAARKIVMIAPAEAMNVNAANSLLKILEEPPEGSLLILVAVHLARVSVTVRSRCRRVAFSTPPSAEALTWLQANSPEPEFAEKLLGFAGGAPLAAVEFAAQGIAGQEAQSLADLAGLARGEEDPVICAERWKAAGTQKSLAWLHRFVVSAIRANAASIPREPLVFRFPGKKHSFAISFIDLFNFADKVSIAIRQLGTGVDEALALEELLIRWCELATTRT